MVRKLYFQPLRLDEAKWYSFILCKNKFFKKKKASSYKRQPYVRNYEERMI
ncbi:hypothetical protein J11TS1_16720 [Oceanobacillus sp. J11TS1]|nr:hypothetical protein J11TS1_16720 [Oceanobacillus sp. J11TS1]